MKADVYQKIEKDFGSDLNLAIELIETVDAHSKGLVSDRILRAIVFLAKGDIDRLKQVIELSRTDYRDVLWQAEYHFGEDRRYDFNRTFHELNLMGE